MPDVNSRCAAYLLHVERRRCQKRTVVGPEPVQYLPHRGFVDAGFLHKPGKFQGAPDRPSFLVEFGQRAEDLLDSELQFRSGQILQNFVGMPRQCIGELANVAVVIQREMSDGALARDGRLPDGRSIRWLSGRILDLACLFPQSREAMLENRQLVHLGAAIIQQPFDQSRIDCGSRLFDRLANNLVQLIACQRRDQKLRRGYGLRQTMKTRAVADEIRTHGQDYVNLVERGPACFQQKLNELRCLVAGADLVPALTALVRSCGRISEQLLELIDHQHKRFAGDAIRLGQRFRYPEARSLQLRCDPLAPARRSDRIIVDRQACEQVRQSLQRLVAGTHVAPQPGAAPGFARLGIEQR